MLLTALVSRFPEVPVAADVLSGSRKGEVFYEHPGFFPREIFKDDLFGEPVIERRCGLGRLIGWSAKPRRTPISRPPASLAVELSTPRA